MTLKFYDIMIICPKAAFKHWYFLKAPIEYILIDLAATLRCTSEASLNLASSLRTQGKVTNFLSALILQMTPAMENVQERFDSWWKVSNIKHMNRINMITVLNLTKKTKEQIESYIQVLPNSFWIIFLGSEKHITSMLMTVSL